MTDLLRLDAALTWFLDSWPYEGPRRPSPNTVRTYGADLRWLVDFAQRRGVQTLDGLTPDLLRLALKACYSVTTSRARNYKGGEAKAHNLVYALRTFVRWLRHQHVAVADFSAIKAPRVPERIQPRLRPEEFQALERATLERLLQLPTAEARFVVARDLALLYLLSDVGLRAAEVCGMRTRDLDLAAGGVFVRQGKGNKQRGVSIADASDAQGGQTMRRLAEWLQVRAELPRCQLHDHLWVSTRGNPLNPQQLRYVLKMMCERAGLDGNRPPHAFRRASFTERYQHDPGSLDVLTARMGWSPNSRGLIATYTRGANLDFAATRALPSLAAQWHKTTVPQPSRKEHRA